MAHKISAVEKNSIAEEVEIEVGDSLLTINGQMIEDALDYHYLVKNTYLEVGILKASLDEEWVIEIDKDEDEDLGIIFDNNLMDDYKSCTNQCVFCFIDQLPQGMRSTLYFKDDDSRLSFLQGNYITLTNMKEYDVERIIKYHLSPMNLSIHSMDMALRQKMLHNRFANNLIDYMDRFYDAGIKMNGQIVLCRGINDGKALDYSIEKMYDYLPLLQSVSVVPVGLTDYREGLQKLEPFTKKEAAQTINIIEKWQEKAYQEHGIHFIHAGDEFYYLAEKEMPQEESYDGYLQYENGVGMTRMFINEFENTLKDLKATDISRKLSIATGSLFAPVLQKLVDKLKKKCHNIEVKIYPITNNYFGNKITVTGLLTGQDIIHQLKGQDIGNKLLLPSNLLKRGESILLDNVSVSDIEKALGVTVEITTCDGDDLINRVLD